MAEYLLAFKPAISHFGVHDPSAAISRDGEIKFGAEEERFTRQKHAKGTFPRRSIEACLDHCGIGIGDIDRILLPYVPKLGNKLLLYDLRRRLLIEDASPFRKIGYPITIGLDHAERRFFPLSEVRARLAELGKPIPKVEFRAHHRCHAASAFHPSGFEEALVVTIDGRGEFDSTVVWHGIPDGLERLHTFRYPNSLGHFYGTVTEYLGYRAFNGEGKIMGLAPYGSRNKDILAALRSLIDVGPRYDVSSLTAGGIGAGVRRLEDLFDRPRNDEPGTFDQWERDLAHTVQRLLERMVTSLVAEHLGSTNTGNLALAGGVALNCKMNKRLMELEDTSEVFIQPVAHDGGLALGALMLERPPSSVSRMSTVYLGPAYDHDRITDLLETNKIDHETPDDPVRYTAEAIADGKLVGWFQGALEMGPRALGNRSILADPRTTESLDRINEFVKHREQWRPFAPSLLEEAADEYLVDAEPAPYMIKTFDSQPERRDDIEAVVHPADDTTRPQTVREDQNPRYYRLIREFERISGVPVVLNTSFNDHGEPIVNTPREAIKDFWGMGLDLLVLGDYIVEK